MDYHDPEFSIYLQSLTSKNPSDLLTEWKAHICKLFKYNPRTLSYIDIQKIISIFESCKDDVDDYLSFKINTVLVDTYMYKLHYYREKSSASFNICLNLVWKLLCLTPHSGKLLFYAGLVLFYLKRFHESAFLFYRSKCASQPYYKSEMLFLEVQKHIKARRSSSDLTGRFFSVIIFFLKLDNGHINVKIFLHNLNHWLEKTRKNSNEKFIISFFLIIEYAFAKKMFFIFNLIKKDNWHAIYYELNSSGIASSFQKRFSIEWFFRPDYIKEFASFCSSTYSLVDFKLILMQRLCNNTILSSTWLDSNLNFKSLPVLYPDLNYRYANMKILSEVICCKKSVIDCTSIFIFDTNTILANINTICSFLKSSSKVRMLLPSIVYDEVVYYCRNNSVDSEQLKLLDLVLFNYVHNFRHTDNLFQDKNISNNDDILIYLCLENESSCIVSNDLNLGNKARIYSAPFIHWTKFCGFFML